MNGGGSHDPPPFFTEDVAFLCRFSKKSLSCEVFFVKQKIHTHTNMTEKLGTKIKNLRESLGLTQADLATAAGIDESQAGLIEADEVSPAISTLIKISRRMGVRLGTLLDGTEAGDPVVTTAEAMAPTINSSKAGNSQHLDFYSLAGQKLDRNMEPFYIAIRWADCGDKKNWSTHEGEEFIYVLEGAIEVHYGKEKFTVGAGESIYYDSIVAHCVGSVDRDAPAKAIAVTYTPN
jgi:transcriptional regulator with XRE-family HTH domain